MGPPFVFPVDKGFKREYRTFNQFVIYLARKIHAGYDEYHDVAKHRTRRVFFMEKPTKFKITIPQIKNGLWHASVISGEFKRKTVASVYRYIERKLTHLFGRHPETKTAVYVKDGRYHNNGEYTNLDSAMYALTAFLEDHLNKEFRDGRYRKYKNHL